MLGALFESGNCPVGVLKKPRARDDPPRDEHWGVLATCKLGVEETLAYAMSFNL
jgi:hypothetical protein